MSKRVERRRERALRRQTANRIVQRWGVMTPLVLLLVPLLLALGLGGWRAAAASLPSSVSASAIPAPAGAVLAAAQPTQAAAASPLPPAPAAVPATGAPASPLATAPAPAPPAHGHWVLAPDALPAPAFPGDVPPLPAAHSAQDPGFHPDLVLKTQTEAGVVTLTCQNPATGRQEVIAGRAGRDTVFALADPQAASLPAAPVQAVAAGALVASRDPATGALVASRDPATGASGYGRVTATVSRPAPALVSLSLSDPKTNQAEALTCTPEHPLYVSGKGWVEAGDLGVGTAIVTRAGPPVVVKSVSWQRDETGKKPFTVYNLTVQGDHTYFAGDLNGGVWAHNNCQLELPMDNVPSGSTDPTRWHHPWPKYLGGEEMQPLVGLPKPYHDAIHNALDQIYDRRLGADAFKNVPRSEIEKTLRDLYNQFPITNFPWRGTGGYFR